MASVCGLYAAILRVLRAGAPHHAPLILLRRNSSPFTTKEPFYDRSICRYRSLVLHSTSRSRRVLARLFPMHRARAAAGIGGTCGPGASPAPGPRESARASPRARTITHIPPGCTPRLQWGSAVARSSTAATAGFVRGHRAPVTTNNRRTHRDTHRRCTRMCKRPNLPPVSRQVQSSRLRAPTTNLTGPVATPAPCGVICHLQPAWIK
jgi:hypothetical protein